jgi:hypothetical protein
MGALQGQKCIGSNYLNRKFSLIQLALYHHTLGDYRFRRSASMNWGCSNLALDVRREYVVILKSMVNSQ